MFEAFGPGLPYDPEPIRARRRRLLETILWTYAAVGGVGGLVASVVVLTEGRRTTAEVLAVAFSGLVVFASFSVSFFQASLVGERTPTTSASVADFLERWTLLEAVLRAAATGQGHTGSERGAAQPVPLSVAVEGLRKSGLWDDGAVNEFRYVLNLRNQVVHGRKPLSREEYALATAYVMDLLQRLGATGLQTSVSAP